MDWNKDGEWNDNCACVAGAPCDYEWAVKDAAITLDAGCNRIPTPAFTAGPFVCQGWMRISPTSGPVFDDFPWAGAALSGGGAYEGGETEDYPTFTEGPTPDSAKSWGSLKSQYRD